MYQNLPTKLSQDTLPTMYDLPSENVGDSGLPDTFHFFQAELLNNTFRPGKYSQDEVFSAIDLNLYYDDKNTTWYKRPDWFGVVGIDRFYQKKDLRSSYVVWDEKVNPFIVVELLSPRTEREDLGEIVRDVMKPPAKWDVYEQILQIPYYVTFDGDKDILRIFKLNGDRYRQLELSEPRLWLNEIGIGISIWDGDYKRSRRLWLRWYDSENNWIPTPEEIADRERQRAEQKQQQLELERQRAQQAEQLAEERQQQLESERQRAESEKQEKERLLAQLKALGIEPNL